MLVRYTRSHHAARPTAFCYAVTMSTGLHVCVEARKVTEPIEIQEPLAEKFVDHLGLYRHYERHFQRKVSSVRGPYQRWPSARFML